LKNYTCCINQFIRPADDLYIPIEGVGNCMICTVDEDNKLCKRYYPIAVATFEIEGE